MKMNKIDKPKSYIIKEKKKREHPITNIRNERTSLVVQWLRLHAPNAGGIGSIPGGEIPHACMPLGMAKKKKKTINARMDVTTNVTDMEKNEGIL